MGGFRKDGNKRFGGHGGGFGKGGGKGGFGGRPERGPAIMHDATCDKCKKPCQVPFRPSGDRPVYCSNCFESKRETGDTGGRDRFQQKSFDSRPPSRQDFRSEGNGNRGNTDELKKQLELLNSKMDRLIKIMETVTVVRPLVAGNEVKVSEAEETVLAGKTKSPSKKVSKK